MEALRNTNIREVKTALAMPGKPTMERSYNLGLILPSSQDYQALRQEATDVVLSHIHPDTGLLPAATNERHAERGHYHDGWIRDGALDLYHLLKSTEFSDVNTPQGKRDLETRAKVGEALSNQLNLIRNGILEDQINPASGNVELVQHSPWMEAFKQPIAYDPVNNLTRLTKQAPPIHMKLDGSHCEWFAQNQPDSWGELLTTIGTAVRLEALKPTDDQVDTVKTIATYLVNIQPERFIASSMWEADTVHTPSSLSNVMMVKEGLQNILPLIRDDQELMGRIVERFGPMDDFIEEQYPSEYSVPEGHYSKSDLATLVAMAVSEQSSVPSPSRYFELADNELWSGEGPGRRRWIGDRYDGFLNDSNGQIANFENGNEALWAMAHTAQSIVDFREAQRLQEQGKDSIANNYIARALERFNAVFEDAQYCGYYPELFVPVELIRREDSTTVVFQPNNNDLLWGRALFAEAAARAEHVLFRTGVTPQREVNPLFDRSAHSFSNA